MSPLLHGPPATGLWRRPVPLLEHSTSFLNLFPAFLTGPLPSLHASIASLFCCSNHSRLVVFAKVLSFVHCCIRGQHRANNTGGVNNFKCLNEAGDRGELSPTCQFLEMHQPLAQEAAQEELRPRTPPHTRPLPSPLPNSRPSPLNAS